MIVYFFQLGLFISCIERKQPAHVQCERKFCSRPAVCRLSIDVLGNNTLTILKVKSTAIVLCRSCSSNLDLPYLTHHRPIVWENSITPNKVVLSGENGYYNLHLGVF